MSQQELAERLNFSSATAISLIESGERKVSIEHLEKIADIFQIDVRFLLGEKIENPEKQLKSALRADKNLTAKDKETILNFYEFIKSKKNEQSRS